MKASVILAIFQEFLEREQIENRYQHAHFTIMNTIEIF